MNDLYMIFEKVDDGCKEVKNILNKISNILNEDILINNVGFEKETIDSLKSDIDVLNKQ